MLTYSEDTKSYATFSDVRLSRRDTINAILSGAKDPSCGYCNSGLYSNKTLCSVCSRIKRFLNDDFAAALKYTNILTNKAYYWVNTTHVVHLFCDNTIMIADPYYFTPDVRLLHILFAVEFANKPAIKRALAHKYMIVSCALGNYDVGVLIMRIILWV